jgi:hypothetical protein
MKFDFTGVESNNRPTVPAGPYLASVVSCKPKKASTGSNMFEWCFQIEDGAYAGLRVWTNTVLLPQVMWRLKNILRGFASALALDLDGEIDFEPEDVIGQLAHIVVTQRTDKQGQLRSDVQNTISSEEYVATTDNDNEEDDEDEPLPF